MKLSKSKLKQIIKEALETLLAEAAYEVGAKVEYDSEDRGVGEVIACKPGAKGDICVRWKDGVSTHHRWALRPAKKEKNK
jgi:hypothetical protein